MSDSPRDHRGTDDQTSDPPPAKLAPEPVEASAPGPSKMRYLAIFFAGILVGRIASQNFAAGPLGMLDLFMYVALALSIAWAWRSWARRAMIQRHLDAERRRALAASSSPRASSSPGSTAPRPRRRRR